MRLGIISDSHGHVQSTLRAIEVFEREGIDEIIHCGDIGSPEVIAPFAGRTTHFVFGNVDHDEADLRHAIAEAGLECHERQGQIDLGGRRIGFVHGDDSRALVQMVESQEYDIVCYGHTHEKDCHQQGRTWLINPGAVYRASPHTVAVVELETMEIRHIAIE